MFVLFLSSKCVIVNGGFIMEKDVNTSSISSLAKVRLLMSHMSSCQLLLCSKGLQLKGCAVNFHRRRRDHLPQGCWSVDCWSGAGAVINKGETWKGVTVGWQNVYHKGFECEKLQETVGHITFSWMIWDAIQLRYVDLKVWFFLRLWHSSTRHGWRSGWSISTCFQVAEGKRLPPCPAGHTTCVRDRWCT